MRDNLDDNEKEQKKFRKKERKFMCDNHMMKKRLFKKREQLEEKGKV